MRVLARYDEYIMQGAQHAGRIQRPECLTITGNTNTPAILRHPLYPELSGVLWQASREGDVSKSMKETLRKRIMVTSSLNVRYTGISWELGGGKGGGLLFLAAPTPMYIIKEPVFINVYGAKESIPKNQFRQPMEPVPVPSPHRLF
jgi:hypothetical protein